MELSWVRCSLFALIRSQELEHLIIGLPTWDHKVAIERRKEVPRKKEHLSQEENKGRLERQNGKTPIEDTTGRKTQTAFLPRQRLFFFFIKQTKHDIDSAVCRMPFIKTWKGSNPDALITMTVEVKKSLPLKRILYPPINCIRKLKRRLSFIFDYLNKNVFLLH